MDKGFPKGGGWGGPTFGKNSQIISFFFLRAYLTSYCDYSDTKFAFRILLTAAFFKNTLITIYRDILYAEKKNGSTNHILGAEATEKSDSIWRKKYETQENRNTEYLRTSDSIWRLQVQYGAYSPKHCQFALYWLHFSFYPPQI